MWPIAMNCDTFCRIALYRIVLLYFRMLFLIKFLHLISFNTSLIRYCDTKNALISLSSSDFFIFILSHIILIFSRLIFNIPFKFLFTSIHPDIAQWRMIQSYFYFNLTRNYLHILMILSSIQSYILFYFIFCRYCAMKNAERARADYRKSSMAASYYRLEIFMWYNLFDTKKV